MKKFVWNAVEDPRWYRNPYRCPVCEQPVSVRAVAQSHLGFKCHPGCVLPKCYCGAQKIMDGRTGDVRCSSPTCETPVFSFSVVLEMTIGGTIYPYWDEAQYFAHTGQRTSIPYSEFGTLGRESWGDKKKQ